MIDRGLVDTNILVYAYDFSLPSKQKSAVSFLENLVASGRGLLSTQVLSEFFVCVTRKIPHPLTPREAEKRVANFVQIWPVLPVNEMIVLEAIRGVRSHKFSYWDGLIWATARLNQVGWVYSEDFTHGSMVEGVRFANPLDPKE